MDFIIKIQEAHNKLVERLEGLLREKEGIDESIRRTRAEMAAVESALDVIKRYDPNAVVDDNFELENPPTDITVEDAMRYALDAGSGLRIGDLIKIAEAHYKITINPKTAGNALWRLKNEGVVYRQGQRWYLDEEES